MSALSCISCAAVLDRFPLVAGTKVHSDCQLLRLFCSFLGLIAPVHAQDVQIRRTAHRVLPAALLLLEQYHYIILMLQKGSLSSDLLKTRSPSKYFLRAADPLDYFNPMTTTQVNFI
jgi:hypothetical protein